MTMDTMYEDDLVLDTLPHEQVGEALVTFNDMSAADGVTVQAYYLEYDSSFKAPVATVVFVVESGAERFAFSANGEMSYSLDTADHYFDLISDHLAPHVAFVFGSYRTPAEYEEGFVGDEAWPMWCNVLSKVGQNGHIAS